MMARMLTIPSRWFAALALAAGVACAGCSGGEAQQQTAQPTGRGGGQNTPVPVTSAPVQQKTVPLDVHAIGTVIAEVGWFATASATATANSGVLVSHVLYSHTHTATESIQFTRTDTL